MLRLLLRRVIGALDNRPDLEAAALLAAVLGWQTGWLWPQLVWPGEGGRLTLGAAGVALGLTVGAAGGLAAQRHVWVGSLQVLGLPGLSVGLATGYAAIDLARADLVARATPLGLSSSQVMGWWWPVSAWVVAALLAAGWGATLFRLTWLARSPVATGVTPPALERWAVAVARAWLTNQVRQRPPGLVTRAADRSPDATRRRGRPAADGPAPPPRRWWIVALGLLVGWPRLSRPGRR